MNGAPFFRKTKAMLLGATRLYPEGEGEEMSLRYPSLFSINCLISLIRVKELMSHDVMSYMLES